MRYQFPVKYFEENIIWSQQNEFWAVYRLMGVSYDHLSTDKKNSVLLKTKRFVAQIGSEAKILIVPIAQDVETHYKRIVGNLNTEDDLYSIAMNHAQGTMNYLKEKTAENGASNDYQVYLLAKLPRPKQNYDFKSIFNNSIRKPVQAINEFMKVAFADISELELKSYKLLSENYFQSQNSRLTLEKVSSRTIQWLIRRVFYRGLSGEIFIREESNNVAWNPMYSTEVLKDGQKIIRPYEKDVLTLADEKIDYDSRGVRITTYDDRISYQTFLAISKLPEKMSFPGGEWLYMLQDYAVATEVCIHITNMDYKTAEKHLENKHTEINSQIEEIRKSSEKIPDDLREASHSVNELEAELSPAADPLCNVSVSLCIAADDPKTMNDNARFIKERYQDMKFDVQRPRSDQMKLFMEFIPGSGRYVNDYILKLPPSTVAGSMFAATNFLGDSEGHFIGTTGILGKNVFLNIARACLLNRSASAAFVGSLGGGKSFNANLLLFLQVLMGAIGLVIDPKAERGVWLERLPVFRKYISVTTLSADAEDQGKLDPFLVCRDNIDEASELAKNIICELYEINSKDDEYLVLAEALLEVEKMENPSMLALENVLENFPTDDELYPHARRLSRRIKATKKIGMARLLFGDGKQEGLNLKNRINILQIQNLNLPEQRTAKEDYTEQEKVSTVLMIPIAAFAKKFAMTNRKRFKCILFDEFWAINTTQVGISLSNFLARMGRSLNAGVIFIGHSVNDFKGEGIKTALTYKFVFQTKNTEEILRVLDFLDLEATDANIELVKKLPNRTCLFQDLDGHVGTLTFDAVWDDFIYAFDTTPAA